VATAIRLAALDPFRRYLAALRAHLPHATHVLDAFHVVRLGFQALGRVRRRVQQEQTGHRGHKHDPLYRTRRLLRCGVAWDKVLAPRIRTRRPRMAAWSP
jgi:transposase